MVVVVAILAAITIAAYNGITTNAKESSLKSDLATAAKKLNVAKIEGDGSYPTAAPANTATTTYQYNRISANQFCLTATSSSLPGKAYNITESGTVQTGACAGHTVGGGGGGEIAANSPIQNVTPAQCQALPVFTGGNTGAIRTVTDSRGGTTRTYEIAKLADNNCWMLTNLKLGSTTGTITLTPADSNVAANFTLPQLITTGAEEYDLPRAYGPAPGDTGSGATNYGYLYNWSAATAGETRTTKPTGNANYSICPANWRLPSGGRGDTQSDLVELDMAFGGSGPYVDNSELNVPNWRFGGAFKGVYSGIYNSEDGNIDSQGEVGFVWSASTDTDWLDNIFAVDFGDTWSAPHSGALRSAGVAVRCLLN